ncbi:SAV_2336 N-terminal domain-related protein [Streptomyces sp. NPDC002888]|uniref:SAV_2336 N-terminal domain-related protein n=1 Tax=Streptomyces sp. NPDC002888 TaxID=3364668 RepID=UPI0036BA3405
MASEEGSEEGESRGGQGQHGAEPSAVARLASVIAAAAAGEAGSPTGPTPLEVAELLWLAGQLGGDFSDEVPVVDNGVGEPGTAAPPALADAPTAVPPPSGPPAQDPAPPTTAPHSDGRVPLHLPAPVQPSEGTGGGPALLAPAPPMLPHPLALQRALRPLKRKVPAPRARVLDERATADRIARLGAHPDVWLPVLRPAPDRWLHLNLVHDAGPTMPVWRPLVRELHTVLAQSGIFRTVTLHPAGPDGRARHVPAPDDGRTVTLLVSDCMGPQWRPGPAGERWYATLRRWADRMPVAVLQPLPEHLWPTTALPAEPGLLTPPAAAAPSSTLAFTPYDPDTPPPPASAVPLPVLEPGAPWIANWAALLADLGGRRMPGAVAWLPTAPPAPTEPAPAVTSSTPEDLVLRFRATASPEAFRLAGHLALAVPSVPVMRLVQRTVHREPRPQHLAEVILSGMLTTAPGPPGSYDFRPGVRDLLLRTLPRSARGRTREFLAEVGALIDDRAGIAAGEFQAERGRDGAPGGAAFATVSEDTVRRLGGDESEELVGGRYRLFGRRGPGRRMWAAMDVRTGQRVVVHLYPEQEAQSRNRFLREAGALAEVVSPHVVRVLDFGMEGHKPYLVVEFEDGVTLTELERGSGPGVSLRVLARVACQGAVALKTLHAVGLVRGQWGVAGLLLRPDGTMVLSRFALGEQSLRVDAAEDELAFVEVVRGLAERAAVPREFESLRAAVASGDRVRYTETELAAAQNHGPLDYRLFGPLTIARPDEPPVTIPSAEARALLSMLLLRAGQRVTLAELAQGIWEQPPPEDEAAHRVHSLAALLARRLGPSSLATLSGGYALYAAGDDIDVRKFEAHLDRAASLEDPQARRHELRRALDLWHDDPLSGVPGPAADATRARLQARCLALRADLAELDPRSGAGGQVPVADDVERRATILFEADDLTGRPEARITLEYAVHQMLSRGALTPQQYEVRVRRDGYEVVTEPGTYLLPVLVAVLRGLPEALSGLTDPPGLRVTFSEQLTELPSIPPADLLVVVPPSLYEQFADSSAAQGSQRFQPLYRGSAPDTPPLAWYCPLTPPQAHAQPEAETRDLVKGPFIAHDLRQLGIPAPGRTAVVHTQPDGPLTLLNPANPHGKRPPRVTTYYEVDLTTHQAHYRVSLPSSGKGAFAAAVQLSWHVEDPVAFVRSESTGVSERLLDHVLESAARITRRHPLRRAGAAQRAVNSGLRRWPVPGLAVACAVQLAPEGAPLPEPRLTAPPSRPLSGLLADAETVLLGFDGPLTRLYSSQTAREAVLDLLALVAEHRDPDDALTGRPLPRVNAAGREVFAHPLDVLRAFAQDRLGPLLRARLDELELAAVPDAPTTHNSVPLVRALHDSGRPVHVVTDVCPQAVHRYLEPYGLPLDGVHGRGEDLGLLMPHPDCLQRALRSPGLPAPTGVVIGSTVAELTAAQQAGLRFVGLARNPTSEQRLREAGCDITVPSLAPVLEAARSL